jgi:hypothetical protein
MHSLELVSQSTTPVVSLDIAKAHLRVSDTNSDAYITALIEVATNLIERESNCDLRTTTWNWKGNFPHPRWHFGFYSPQFGHDFVDGFYRQYRTKIFLPRAPLQSITSITYYDANNTLQSFTNTDSTTNYYVMTPSKVFGWLQPALYYPATYDAFRPDAVTITFTSGYNPAPPAAIHAVLLAVGTWYENREDENEARLSSLGLGFDRILDQLTVVMP